VPRLRTGAGVDRSDNRRSERDGGAAVIDFVLVSVLLVLLLLAVLQVALYFYARNVVAASAADAARFAAAEGIAPGEGGRRAAELIRHGLAGREAAAVRCTGAPGRDAASGLAVTTVHCSGRVRILFSRLTMPLTIDVRSSVLREGVP
jgi:Flp pilus assembly protein TadG